MRRDRLRNYLSVVLEKTAFTNGMVFLSVNAVMPFFIQKLGGGAFEIALTGAAASVGMLLSQPIFGSLASRYVYLGKAYLRFALVQRTVFLLGICPIPLLAGKLPSLTMYIFIGAWYFYNFFGGMDQPFYYRILSKTVKEEDRGRLTGISTAVANSVALGSVGLLGVVITRVAFPYNYFLAFLIGIVFMYINAVSFALFKEPEEKAVAGRLEYFGFIKNIPKGLLADKKILRIIIGFCFLVLTNGSLTYYTAFAAKQYQAGDKEIALFSTITVVISMLGSVCFGFITDRFGAQYSILYCGIAATAAGAVVVLGKGMPFVYIGYALASLCNCGYIGNANLLLIKHTAPKQIPRYIAINAILTLFIQSLFTLLSGGVWIRNSYLPVFAAAMIGGLTSVLLFLKPDKREHVKR